MKEMLGTACCVKLDDDFRCWHVYFPKFWTVVDKNSQKRRILGVRHVSFSIFCLQCTIFYSLQDYELEK